WRGRARRDARARRDDDRPGSRVQRGLGDARRGGEARRRRRGAAARRDRGEAALAIGGARGQQLLDRGDDLVDLDRLGQVAREPLEQALLAIVRAGRGGPRDERGGLWP